MIRLKLKDYLELMGHRPPTGTLYHCINPEHDDRTPSMSLFGDDPERPTRFTCFGACKQTGDIFTAAHLLEDKPLTGPEFITENVLYLANLFGIEIHLPEHDDFTKKQLLVRKLYGHTLNYIMAQQPSELFMAELERRGWSIEIARKLCIGCVPSYADYFGHIKGLGFSNEIFELSGLNMPSLFNESNMIFTVKDINKYPAFFVGRNLLYVSDNSAGPKYYNSTKSEYSPKTGLQKGHIFNLPTLGSTIGGKIYVVEGIADAVSLINAGLPNVIAILGSKFTREFFDFLSTNGVYDIAFCLDGDHAGIEAIRMIMKDMAESGFVRSHIVSIPGNLDPDEYIRTNNLEAFLALPTTDTFEHYLKNLDITDTLILLNQGTELILSQPNTYRTNEMVEILAKLTSSDKKDIRAEIERRQKLANRVEQDRQLNELQKALTKANMNPENAVSIMETTVHRLAEQHKQKMSTAFDQAAMVHELVDIKIGDEEKSNRNMSGFKYDKLRNLAYALNGDWTSGKVLCFAGKPNTGKTALMSQQALELSSMNENALVLIHSTDDTMEDYVTRLITQIMSPQMPDVTLNMVSNPYYQPIVGHLSETEHKRFIELREYAYSELVRMANHGHLLIRDARHGKTIGWASDWVEYCKSRYPDKRIILICDNMYNYQDQVGGDERGRIINLISFLKVNIAVKHEIAVLTTVEYRKIADGVAPTNSDIAETVSVEYKANFVAHLDTDRQHYHVSESGDELPVVKLIIGKNKITGVKDMTFKMKFYPSQSRFEDGDEGILKREAAQIYTPNNAGGWHEGRRIEANV